MDMKILMTGATGLLGQEIGIELLRRGHELFVVSRDKKKAQLRLPFPCKIIEGDLNKGILKSPDLKQMDGVINLMGESLVSSRWSVKQKAKIFNSRIIGTRNLVNSFLTAPKVFVSASAVGFYGDAGDTELTEESNRGPGFLPEVCEGWEKEADEIKSKGNTRVVKGRLSAVLARQGGALDKMLPAFKTGVGGRLSTGKQWMSWIHIQDAVDLFVNAIENEKYEGVLNFSSPEPVTNLEFSKQLAGVLNRSLGPAVPAFALKALFGEMSQVLLDSQKTIPAKAISLGYQFKFPALQSALLDILKYENQGEDVFEAKQYLPLPKQKVFEFFADAQNLEKITPNNLNFHIQDVSTPEMQQGTIINYKLKIQGVPVRWQTLIEKWDPPTSFVDTALKGPYKFWHHTHTFESLGEGTLMTDQVRYVLPMGRIGWMAAYKKVSGDVSKIFDFRRGAVADHFKIK